MLATSDASWGLKGKKVIYRRLNQRGNDKSRQTNKERERFERKRGGRGKEAICHRNEAAKKTQSSRPTTKAVKVSHPA